ncbi:DNA-binding protein [Bacteroidia bacterium]|nr:DNA-binding protein [Bacteroidia bacterium]
MNHAELITTLAKRLQLSKEATGKKIDEAVSVLAEELVKGNAILVPDFGSFEVRKRNERISIHPAMGKKLLVPPKLVVKYKPATILTQKTKELK